MSSGFSWGKEFKKNMEPHKSLKTFEILELNKFAGEEVLQTDSWTDSQSSAWKTHANVKLTCAAKPFICRVGRISRRDMLVRCSTSVGQRGLTSVFGSFEA